MINLFGEVIKKKTKDKRKGFLNVNLSGDDLVILKLTKIYKEHREAAFHHPYNPVSFKKDPRKSKNWKCFKRLHQIATVNEIDPEKFLGYLIDHYSRMNWQFPMPNNLCSENALHYVDEQRQFEGVDFDEGRTETVEEIEETLKEKAQRLKVIHKRRAVDLIIDKVEKESNLVEQQPYYDIRIELEEIYIHLIRWSKERGFTTVDQVIKNIEHMITKDKPGEIALAWLKTELGKRWIKNIETRVQGNETYRRG